MVWSVTWDGSPWIVPIWTATPFHASAPSTDTWAGAPPAAARALAKKLLCVLPRRFVTTCLNGKEGSKVRATSVNIRWVFCHLPVDRIARKPIDYAKNFEPEHPDFFILVRSSSLIILPSLHNHRWGTSLPMPDLSVAAINQNADYSSAYCWQGYRLLVIITRASLTRFCCTRSPCDLR